MPGGIHTKEGIAPIGLCSRWAHKLGYKVDVYMNPINPEFDVDGFISHLDQQSEALQTAAIDHGEDTPFNDRRFGTFALSMDWLEDMKQKDAEQIFKHFRIIRAELDYSSNQMLYTAASFLFDRVPENTMAPGYFVMVDADAGKINIRVRKA